MAQDHKPKRDEKPARPDTDLMVNFNARGFNRLIDAYNAERLADDGLMINLTADGARRMVARRKAREAAGER